ncbi:MAG: DUF4430 domain-containing protein [bacterium]
MTKKEKNKKLIFIIILIAICVFLIYLFQNKPKEKIEAPPPPNNTSIPVAQKETNGITTTLFINDLKYESKIDKQESVYDLMQQLQKEGKINFKEQNYMGMGKFIEEINGIKSDGEKYWIYYVNNKKAEIGISNYKINPGDTVSWKYEKNTY